MQEKQPLDRALLESWTEGAMTARIDFEALDVILAVEAVGDQAGMSPWLRMDLQRYPLQRQSCGLEQTPGLTSCSESKVANRLMRQAASTQSARSVGARTLPRWWQPPARGQQPRFG